MTEETLYRKIKGKYVAVSKYSEEYNRSFPINSSVLTVTVENSSMQRYDITPADAPFVAAALLLKDNLTDIIAKSMRPQLENQNRTVKYTEEEISAWNELVAKFNFHQISLQSYNDIAESILSVIKERAIELMRDKNVEQAYNEFLLLATLVKK